METPKKLGKYEVVGLIGEGGFGVVYEARDPFIRRRVAIKACTARDGELRNRFYREAQIAGNLQHKNIVTVHDFGLENDVPYLVQEYLSGEDLHDKIRRGDAIPPLTKLNYLVQIAEGLEFAHEAGVIHRDIKPSNVRILENGRVKIMDFGIARLAAADSKFTKARMAMGTQGYMSPEQLEGQEVDQRSDVFSYGVLAYELLTYRKPFEADSFQALFYQILNKTPTPIRELWPECPRSVARFVETCLQKRREDRFSGFAELLKHLQVARGDTGASGAPTPPPESAPLGIADPAPAVTGHASAPAGGHPPTPIPTALGALEERVRQAMERGDMTTAELEVTLARKKHAADKAFAAVTEPLLRSIREARETKEEEVLRPERAAALVLRARQQRDQGALENALLASQAALELTPADPVAMTLHAELADTISREQRRQAALQEAGAALEKDDLERASRLAHEALDLGPQDSQALELQRRVEQAEHEVSRKRGRARRLVEEAGATLQQGDAQRAQLALNEAVSLWPEVPEAADLRELIEAALVRASQAPSGGGSPLISATAKGPPRGQAEKAVGELRIESLFARRYRIKGKLGQGGMGTVYRALDQTLEVPVALKVINTRLARDKQMLDRLKREVVLARKIAHPSVCRMHDIGEADGLHYVSMELVEGSDLSEVIRKAQRLHPDQAVEIALQVLDGLREAHRAGVIHRDLKPQNIMLGTDGRPHIMDFGISVSADVQRLTQKGVVVGTPDYMSPEQALGSKVDHRADIYAMGVILFRMLTGRMPFEGKTPEAVMVAHFTAPPPRASEVMPGVPPALDAVIEKALAKKPEDRFSSAQEMEGVLKALAAPGLRAAVAVEQAPAPAQNPITPAGAKANLDRGALLAWIEEARGRLERGDITDAETLVDRTLEHEPELEAAKRVKDEIRLARERRQTLAQLPQAVRDLLSSGRSHLERGDLKQAMAAADRALGMDPAQPDSRELKEQVQAAVEAARERGEQARLEERQRAEGAQRRRPEEQQGRLAQERGAERRAREAAEAGVGGGANQATVQATHEAMVVARRDEDDVRPLSADAPSPRPRRAVAPAPAARPAGRRLVLLAVAGAVVVGGIALNRSRPQGTGPPATTAPPATAPPTTEAVVPSTTQPPPSLSASTTLLLPTMAPNVDPRAEALRTQLAARLSRAQVLYGRGAREEALQAAEEGLRSSPKEPGLTSAVQGWLRDARAGAAQARDEAQRLGDLASSSPLFAEAEGRERDAQRQNGAGHPEEAIRSFWAAETAYRR